MCCSFVSLSVRHLQLDVICLCGLSWLVGYAVGSHFIAFTHRERCKAPRTIYKNSTNQSVYSNIQLNKAFHVLNKMYNRTVKCKIFSWTYIHESPAENGYNDLVGGGWRLKRIKGLSFLYLSMTLSKNNFYRISLNIFVWSITRDWYAHFTSTLFSHLQIL